MSSLEIWISIFSVIANLQVAQTTALTIDLCAKGARTCKDVDNRFRLSRTTSRPAPSAIKEDSDTQWRITTSGEGQEIGRQK